MANRACATHRSSFLAIFICLVLLLHPLEGLLIPSPLENSSVATGKPAANNNTKASRHHHRWTLPTVMRRRKTTETSSKQGGDEDVTPPSSSDVQVTEQKALDSLAFCYRAALIAAVIGAVTTLVENVDQSSNLLFQATELLTVLHRFIFGFGIRRVWRVYEDTKGDKNASNVTPLQVYEIANTMSGLWQSSAIVITMGAMVLSTSIKDEYTGSGAVYNWISSTMLERPGDIVLTLALVSIWPIMFFANKAAARAEAAGKLAGSPDFGTARSMGFVAARNMRFCMGAFALLGVTQLVTAVTKTTKMATGLGLLDVIESITIGGLLAKLNHSFLRAIVTVTEGGNAKSEAYLDLYEAQTGFYSKVGKVFNSQSFFKVLPYVAAGGKVVLNVFQG